MQTTKEYINLLKRHSAILQQQYNMSSLIIFGSVARGEQNKDSDVDVLVDLPASLRLIGGANDYLEHILGCRVDMVRRHNNLTPFFLKQVERDGIKIF